MRIIDMCFSSWFPAVYTDTNNKVAKIGKKKYTFPLAILNNKVTCGMIFNGQRLEFI